ncbi:MAG TPA: cellulose binding domain-containing protein, partial [Polyangia bacterium]|nr:cellulose binding domain-containing protein [Polyangia bacterium]
MLVASTFVACGDPDKYFRHGAEGEGGAGGIAVMVGTAGAFGGTAGAFGNSAGAFGGTAGATSSSTAGSIGSTGGAGGTAGNAGAAGSVSGTAGSVGGTAGSVGGTAGATGGAAGAGGAGTCPGCKITVDYTCNSGAPDQALFVVDATNAGSSLVLLKDLTLRYWFTVDAGKAQELDCDQAQLTCAYILTSMSTPPVNFVPVTPPRTNANEYLEIAFKQGAIDVNGKTGTINLRLHNKDFTPMNQADDYSADCG